MNVLNIFGINIFFTPVISRWETPRLGVWYIPKVHYVGMLHNVYMYTHAHLTFSELIQVLLFLLMFKSISSQQSSFAKNLKNKGLGISCGPVVRTPCFHCYRQGFKLLVKRN